MKHAYLNNMPLPPLVLAGPNASTGSDLRQGSRCGRSGATVWRGATKLGPEDDPVGVVPAEGAVAQVAEAEGAVEGAGRGVEVVGDQPGAAAAGPGEQPPQQFAADAAPAPVGADGDPDHRELAGQPALGGVGTDGLAQAAVPALGRDLGGRQAVGEAGQLAVVVVGRPAAEAGLGDLPGQLLGEPAVSTSVSWNGAAPMAAR